MSDLDIVTLNKMYPCENSCHQTNIQDKELLSENSILKKQIEELKTKNEKLEKERDAERKKSLQLQSDLRDQKTSLTSAVTEKQRIESQFNQQKTTINELESSKEAAERQASHCNRELGSKRSQVYRLESENGRLENSADRCNRDLRTQRASLASIEERYNSMINTPSSIRVNVDAKSTWKDKNLSGYYHLSEFYNERPVYKRDKNAEDGDEVYIYYDNSDDWQFTRGSDFRAKNGICFMYLESSERDIRKISGTWKEAPFASEIEAKVTIY